MTINEGLTLLKAMKQRHGELVGLQRQCGKKSTHYYSDSPIVDEPTYDIKDLDKKIGRLAREIRHLDSAIKKQNAITEIEGYNDPAEDIWDGPQ
jgi:hypothetical protein